MTVAAATGDALAHDVGTLLFITCPDQAFNARLTLLSERFAFTNMELTLCRALLQGLDLRAAGAAAGLTYETTRWYCKQLLAKTGTHRQADLVRVLMATKAEIAIEPPVPE